MSRTPGLFRSPFFFWGGPLSRNIMWIFFSYLPGNFALKAGGDFWWIFSGLRCPRNEARKLLNKFGENSERNSGQNSGHKFEKFGELSFCDLSDLIFLFAESPGWAISGYKRQNVGQEGQGSFQPGLQHFYFSHRPSPLLRGRRLSGYRRGSVLSRFSVGFWSVLVIFDQNWPKIDRKPTQSRPLAKSLVGVCCLWRVTVCGWNKSVDLNSWSVFFENWSCLCTPDCPPPPTEIIM